MGQLIMRDLRREIFGHLQRLPVSYFDRNPIGRLVTRVTTDVDALNEIFTAGLVSIVGDLLLLTGIVAVLFWLDWRLAVAGFAIVPLLVALTFWFRARARQSFREVRVKIARINAFLQEHITGMPVVQLFNRESRRGARVRRHRRRLPRRQRALDLLLRASTSPASSSSPPAASGSSSGTAAGRWSRGRSRSAR